MKVVKFAITDASLERSPGQQADIQVGNLIDERHGGPITIGYGRYAPDQVLSQTMAVDDVMVVLAGGLIVSTDAGTITAGPGEIVYMPKCQTARKVAPRSASNVDPLNMLRGEEAARRSWSGLRSRAGSGSVVCGELRACS